MATVLPHAPPPLSSRWCLPSPSSSYAFAANPLLRNFTASCYSTSLSASAPIVGEDSPPPSGNISSPDVDSTVGIEELPYFRGCKTCGREELEKGCNGEGRIQGGIATVPGFGWWPIKAFRPCPGFVASGGRYRRRGQSMDEVAWGKIERDISVKSIDKAKSNKKKQGQRRLKS
ncbi:hypothetical protein AXF42_Ash017224 [Apostasia shenzhenica]|uniref:Uncharacterized protein n=1 Tax=Apostasia shenzhenica TaxID=1088818 RepID=A0A2H9ZVD7_9ASPA|nr:hypothetical protein AXF42_Ash017224 [Apostasia shenzhenica]